MRTKLPVPPPDAARWFARLRRHIGWMLLVKLALLAGLFTLFFSAAHRPDIDAAAISERLQLQGNPP
ncbi:MAG: hypothetical protein COW59_08035 [Lysobacterales bacterium CG17_big_fil_post_rev_8_21_14_2_50_64_11]|nr:MAG: hypothetical protein COW59_08035 [Xanthomonadales bacterium CG17_big_fil_post_rev_8_21_14_2_50_64_11]